MFYQTYEESIQKMVCKDCLYRKYDRYIDGILLEGFRGSACVKFIRKPSEIFEYGCDCWFYQQQKDGEKCVWESEAQGEHYFQTLFDEIVALMNAEKDE